MRPFRADKDTTYGVGEGHLSSLNEGREELSEKWVSRWSLSLTPKEGITFPVYNKVGVLRLRISTACLSLAAWVAIHLDPVIVDQWDPTRYKNDKK